MSKCGNCQNFIHHTGSRGHCKVKPYRIDEYGQTVRICRFKSQNACKKFEAQAKELQEGEQ